MARVLIIDDNETLREGAAAVARRMGHQVSVAENGLLGMKTVEETPIDVLVTDLKMEGMDGIEVLQRVKKLDSDIAVIMMTAFGTVEVAVDAMKLGAFDFFQKPFSHDAFRLKLSRAVEWQSGRRRVEQLAGTHALLQPERSHLTEPGFGGMVGQSAALKKIFKVIERVAPGDTSVAISGESGTGKELVASAVHALSTRHKGPFIKINCGAIPENLIESELFGHEQGAFTGATERKLGRFELANSGTLFLDEVGELPLAMQVKLLRALQDRVIDRIGGSRPIPVDIRVVSATNKQLSDEVAEGRFREDLYYRLQVLPIELPPLRERTEDIAPLARHFVRTLRKRANPEVEGLSPSAIQTLEAYHYPGNIRELANIIEQSLVFAEGRMIDVEDLPPQVRGLLSEPTPSGPRRGKASLPEFLETVERREILEAYEGCGRIKTETARRLGLKSSALYYKLEKYGIE